MTIEANARYKGTITAADYYESQNETLAIQVEIAVEGETAPVYHELWLSPKTKERTGATLAEFGIDVKDKTFWEDPGPRLIGQHCDFSTKLDDRGKVRVQWFNGPLRKANRATVEDKRGAAAKAAAMFASDDSVPW